MPRKVTSYPDDFKKSSAQLAVESDKSLAQTAQDLGVNKHTLYGWVTRYYPTSPLNTSQKVGVNEEIKKLRQENHRLRQERDILKKAAAYFAKNV